MCSRHSQPGRVVNSPAQVSCGFTYGVALLTNSTVWTWGSGFSGELGAGTNTQSLIPIQVPGVSNSMFPTGGHSLALKSDGTLAVVTRAQKERADFFERAVQFNGRSRERVQAIGFACCHFANVCPDYYNVEMMLKSLSFWEKADETRQRQYAMQGGRCFRSIHGLVTDGLKDGDLPKANLSPERIVFALASTAIGSHIMSRNSHALVLAGIDDPLRALCDNVNVLLDGLSWKPLSSEVDHNTVDRRIKKEIFPEATWFKN